MSFDKSKLFSTKQSEAHEVTACGQTFTVHVRRLPAVDLRTFHAEAMSDDIAVRARAGFTALQKSIRNADDSAFATLDEYHKMDAEAVAALMDAFTRVNAQKRDDSGNA